MRSHEFINSLLYLIIQLVAKESRANENNGGIRCFFVLFIDKRYISQVIHFKKPSTKAMQPEATMHCHVQLARGNVKVV